MLWGASGRRLCGWALVNHSCWRTCTKQHGWERWREDWETCELQVREEGGEADKGGYRGAGIGAPGACCVAEHVVVRALGGDGPLFVVADFDAPSTCCSPPSLGVACSRPLGLLGRSSNRTNATRQPIKQSKLPQTESSLFNTDFTCQQLFTQAVQCGHRPASQASE